MSWISGCMKEVVAQRVLPQHTHAVIVCSSELKKTVNSLKAAFPPTALHAFAAKANVTKGVLQVLKESGMGCETASLGEFTLAKQVALT